MVGVQRRRLWGSVMRVQLPVGRLITFAAHAAAKAKGGITPAEGRELAGELLGIVAPPLVGLAPPAVGSVLGPVLDTMAGMLTDPPDTVEEAAARVVAAVAPFAPEVVDLHLVSADPVVEIVNP